MAKLEIKLAVHPPNNVLKVGKAKLDVRSGVDNIKIWTDQNRTTEVKSGDDWDIASMPETLYVEGIKACDNMCDVSIALEYSRGSFTCDDLIKMTVIKVEVTNIKFNHTTTSSMYDAINIRQDYTNGYDISEGEWILGATNIPVCYTTNKAVTIKASFTVQPADITSADIWAVSTDSDGSLGDVVITNVTFSGGVSSPKYVTFNVSGKTPSAIKKTTGDIWQWKMGNVNAPSPYVYSLNTSGVHTVYTILKEPVSPWVNTFGNTQNAWSTALDIVCSPAWAGGEASEIAAATGITKAINGSGRFKYDIASGAAMYIDGGSVTLSKCIQRLNGGNGAGELVNCTDCANFVTIFANLIGGELYSSRMYTPGISFGTNPYSAIGRSAWTPPNWGWGFSYQEVGWTGNCGDGDLIFDPCLKVDGDGDPSALPQTELLPTGMMFSDGNQAAPFVYRERLASPGANGYGLCVARPTTKQRRSFK